MGWRGFRQFVFGFLAVWGTALMSADASAQVSCTGVPAFASCTAYANGASVTYGGSKYTSIAPIPNNRDCPPNSPYNPSNDNWWTNNGTCSGGATATSTATATRTATATATTSRATATPTTARATATATATTARATATATSRATATATSTATATRTATATATTATATPTATTSGVTWSDEFGGSGAASASNWVYETGGGGWGNSELEYYQGGALNGSQSGGYFNIQARQESVGGMAYTSARVKTQGIRSFGPYGKMEARLSGPNGQGFWPAFWMLGTNIATVPWPGCGEIDIMEHISNVNTAFGTIHWDSGGYQYYTAAQAPMTSFTSYHTYAVDWSSSQITWLVDNVSVGAANIANSINGTDEFHKSFFVLLNLAVGGSWPGNPDGTTVFPATFSVDYVRWTAGSGTPPPTPTATTSGPTPTATAPPAGDFTQGVASLNGTQALAWFTPNGYTAGYVILHYTPPGQGQQNVNMVYNTTSARWEFTMSGLSTGSVVSYFFTYQKPPSQYDSATFSYTHGGGSATPTATSRPGATATATATTSGGTATPTSAGGGCPGCTNKRLKVINGCGQPMWIQYLNGAGGGSLTAPNRYQLATLNSFIEYDIPDAGIAGVRFWPGMGCDASGQNCTIGASGGPASMGFNCPAAGCGPPIDSKFEASFGCLPGVASASCQQNPSAPGTPLGRVDWWNSSAVDGYTLPFQVKALGSCPTGPQPDGPGGPPGGVVSCTSIKFADCPATENLSSNNQYPSLASVNLKLTNPSNGAQAGCFSPVGKLTYSQWNAGFTTYPPTDPHAQWYACPTPPITPDQCSAGPAASTAYRNLIHAKCTNTYAYAYDDTFGLATCPSATNMKYEVTFYCPQ